MHVMPLRESSQDMDDLRNAVNLLESSSISMKIVGYLGKALDKLPDVFMNKVHAACETALHGAVKAALWTMDSSNAGDEASPIWHKIAAGASGFVGGFSGLTAILAELPVSITIMMRSVADIARSEGFDLENTATQRACVEVFALGKSSEEDESSAHYYETRAFLTAVTAQTSVLLAEAAAAREAAEKTVRGFSLITVEETGSALAKLIEAVAARLGITISEKVAAQVVPVIGGIAGAGINLMFIDHYQDMARGHFIIKRLEAKHGVEVVEQVYRELASIPKQK